MIGIVGAIPQTYEDKARALWDLLEKEFGAKTARSAGIPHFTYIVGKGERSVNLIDTYLYTLAQASKPFPVHIQGVRAFASETPIIYLRVRPSVRLRALHEQVWNTFAPIIAEPNPLYDPANWTPHVTMVWGDLPNSQKAAAMRLLREQKIDWTFETDKFTLIEQVPGKEANIVKQYRFEKIARPKTSIRSY